MSFFASRNSTPVVLISLVLLGASSYYFINKSQNEKQLKAEKLELQAQQSKERKRKLAEERAQRLAEKEAKLAAAEAKKEAELAAQAEIKAEKLRKEKELAAELEAIKQETERRNTLRTVALANYVGTKYASLKVAGKKYNDVTVTKATAAGVTIAYEHGARRFKYADLPLEIQELCHYDAEISKNALISEQKAKLRHNQVTKLAPSPTRSRPVTANKPSKESSSITKPAPKPRGSITARVTSQRSGNDEIHYRDSKKYNYHYKTVQVSARSNVPAKLYNNGSFIGSVSPGTTAKFTTRSDYKGKYRLELKSNSGRLLDSEAHNRKSGLH